MNVMEATKKALELNTAFYRPDEQPYLSDLFIGVIPLKEPLWNLLIIMPYEYLSKRPESAEDWREVHLCGGWNPSAEDILYDDWKVMDPLELKNLIDNGKVVQNTWWSELKNKMD